MFGKKVLIPLLCADCKLKGEKAAAAAAPQFCEGEDRFRFSMWTPLLVFTSGKCCVLLHWFLLSCFCLAGRLQVAFLSTASGWIALQWWSLLVSFKRYQLWNAYSLFNSCSSETSLYRYCVSTGGVSYLQDALSSSAGVFCNREHWWDWITLYEGWRQVSEVRELRSFPLCFSHPLIWCITDRRSLKESEGLPLRLNSCSLDVFAAGIG